MSTDVLRIESLRADLHRLQLPFAPLRIQV